MGYLDFAGGVWYIMRASYAGLAQLVEQLICNQQAGGSSPSTSSKNKERSTDLSLFFYKDGLEMQRLRAPAVRDAASKGWRRGRNSASESENTEFRAPQEGERKCCVSTAFVLSYK